MEEDEEEVADDLVVVFLLVLDFLVAAVLDPAGVLFVLCLGLSVTASTLFAPASSSMWMMPKMLKIFLFKDIMEWLLRQKTAGPARGP